MRLQNSLLSNQQNKHTKIDNIEELSNIINQIDKTDSCRMYYPNSSRTYFFSNTYKKRITKIDHILGITQISTKLKGLKSYKKSSLNRMELN